MDDIVAAGLDLKPETLIQAYSNGIFPWPTHLEGQSEPVLLWYCPKKRAILPVNEVQESKRLIQYHKKSNWTFTVDQAFESVIFACRERGDEGTWITDDMVKAYIKLHHLGHAHSIEVWETNETQKKLVGGLYGVDIANSFAGESMFHHEDHASKAAVLFVCDLLRQAGRNYLDIQVLTPHLEAMGAIEITRGKFLKLLENEIIQNQPIEWKSKTEWSLQTDELGKIKFVPKF